MKLILFLLVLFSFVLGNKNIVDNNEYIILDENCNSKCVNICKDINKIIRKNNFYPQEKWVLEQLCDENVEEANLTVYLKSNNLNENNNILTEKFLKTIILSNNFENNMIKIRNAILYLKSNNLNENNNTLTEKFLKTIILSNNFENNRIKIRNAIFDEKIDLSNLEIRNRVEFYDCNFTQEVYFINANFNNSIGFFNSNFNKKVFFNRLNINGQLALKNSIFENNLTMEGIKVKGSLYLDEHSFFQAVKLLNAEIGEQLIFSNSIFNDIVNMQSIKVDYVLFIDENASFKEINLGFSNIENLYIEESNYSKIDLENSRINGVLNIDKKGNEINLKNSQITTFDIHKENNISLLGFNFKTLSEKLVKEKNMETIKSMLSNADYYHSNYQQFADFYKRIGEKDKAEELLFLSHLRNLENNPTFFEIFSLIFVGFGYKLSYAVIWVLFFTLLGASIVYDSTLTKTNINNSTKINKNYNKKNCLIRVWDFLMITIISPFLLLLQMIKAIVLIVEFICCKENIDNNSNSKDIINDKKWALAYSFDKLIPFVTLNKEHEDLLPTTRWKRGYFYFHQIMGYVLATFIIIGISRILS